MRKVTTAARGALAAVRAAWPDGPPGRALLALLLAGVVLRLIAIVSWWPVTTTLIDSYERYMGNPFDSPLHPAGYSGILAIIGLVTHQIAVPVLLQHLSGIASALLLYGATRRITGSAWAGTIPAAIVLLDPDFIFLEHSIMSESWFVLTISAALYAAVRALEEPQPYWHWPLLTALILSVAVTIRSAALFLIPIAVVALLVWQPWSSHDRPLYVRSAITILGASFAILLLFATANAVFGPRFGLGASPGWYLYARAAQFADCTKFTPPEGTDVLCERRPPSERPGTRYYAFDRTAPAQRHFGRFGADDGRLGDWARRAILAQPGGYLANIWQNIRGYWIPELRPKDSTLSTAPWDLDQGLDPQLAFTNGFYDSGLYHARPFRSSRGYTLLPLRSTLPRYETLIQRELGTYFTPFTAHMHRPGLEFLRGWQRIVRFGGTALVITTVLTLLGLAVGTRRSRVGVLLFGAGGLSLLIAPAMTANYWGRYLVPLAGPMMVAGTIAIAALLGRWLEMPVAHRARTPVGRIGGIE